ncbi:unnamed protein product [Bursaphelenchus okinawaensis]|uniref:Uncharacterized protein n=1 Tax=Bursaphelenchus okinawaensis TaxID=465554 RepID=A0A811JQC2_9BILA|nr:unnamed protein product [Bursaphelenchus okinawaensis]CAG9078080.1 unnamed protein product [Bursaphelenchus okinawaensis]
MHLGVALEIIKSHDEFGKLVIYRTFFAYFLNSLPLLLHFKFLWYTREFYDLYEADSVDERSDDEDNELHIYDEDYAIYNGEDYEAAYNTLQNQESQLEYNDTEAYYAVVYEHNESAESDDDDDYSMLTEDFRVLLERLEEVTHHQIRDKSLFCPPPD